MFRIRHRLVAPVVALALVAAAAGPAMAIGPFTLPFFTSQGTNQPYGCTSGTAEYPWTGYNADGTHYSCAHFHNGIYYDLVFEPVVSATAGRVVSAVDTHPDNAPGTCPANLPNNYITIDNGSGYYSVYAHIEQGGALVQAGDHVSAGQHIATSGNSGMSCGAHLHFEETDDDTLQGAHSYNPAGKWTTTNGSLPWLANFSSQYGGSGIPATIHVMQATTTTVYWVKFSNAGGRDWSTSNDVYGHGQLVLLTTDSGGVTTTDYTIFQAADWIDAHTPTILNAGPIGPGGVGQFSFNIKGNHSPGTFTLYATLLATGLHKFNYSTLGSYRLTIVIDPNCSISC